MTYVKRAVQFLQQAATDTKQPAPKDRLFALS
jgi:hypothetical protein